MKIIRNHRSIALAAPSIAVLLASTVLLSACSTVEGLGNNTQRAIADATGENAVRNQGSVEGQGADQAPARDTHSH